MTEPIKIDEIDGFIKYIKSINWQEPWLCCLVAFHVITLIVVLFTRRRSQLHTILFFTLLSVAFFSEQINQWAAHNWKAFASEQYFDSNGLFISVVFSVPILVNCLVIVAFLLWGVGQMLITVGQAKVKHGYRQQQKKDD